MKLNFRIRTAVVFAGLAAGVMLWHAPAQAQERAAKQAAKGKGGAGGFIKSNDPRVQNRTTPAAGMARPSLTRAGAEAAKRRQAPSLREIFPS